LCEGRVLRDQVGGSDIVDAGIAEDVLAGLLLADIAAVLADDDAEFAFVDNVAGIGFRPADRLAVRQERARRLEELERLVLRHHVQAGGQSMKIVPQADHLARHRRRQNLDFVEANACPGWRRVRKHVTIVDGDPVPFERTESNRSVLFEPNPPCHCQGPLIPCRSEQTGSHLLETMARIVSDAKPHR